MDYNSALTLIESKAAKYGAPADKCAAIRQEIKDFAVSVIMVGAFSAGKSALLNTFMGDNVLREGQRPENAIASELVYDAQDYVEAYANGQASRFTPDEALELDANRYDYLRWHLRNEALAGIPGYILVDMPGFNSSIQAHNKAILRYIDKAAAYLLVIDVEEGGIKQSMADFLREIRNYQHNLAIIVSKCDLKSPDEAAAVAASVAAIAESMFGKNIPVITASKDDSDTAAKLNSLIHKIDRENIQRQRFIPKIKAQGAAVLDIMQLRKNSEKLNVSELQEQIAEKQKAKKKIEQDLRAKLAQLREKYGYQAESSIMGEVERALSSAAPELASCLKSGSQAFNSRVNSILRPVLANALQNYTEQSFEQFLPLLDTKSGEGEGENKLAQLLENDKAVNLYRATTVMLGLTTTVLAPWLEALIIFLPEILRIFTPKKDQQAELEQKVRGEIIPQIVSRLRPEIGSSLRDILERMQQELQEAANDKLDAESEALQDLQEQKQSRQEEHERQLGEIENDIRELSTMLEKLAL
ncbi:MAG: dynamin family protein [bacterium]|nr:dynamin family protein [bacterium]